VAVRDVTSLRQAELKAAVHARELKMIGQILAIEPSNFDRLIAQSTKDLNHAIELLHSANTQKTSMEKNEWISINIETMKIIFRILHTLKGNTRSYLMEEVAFLIHEAEQFYSDFIKSPDYLNFNSDILIKKINDILDNLIEYEDLNRTKLGGRVTSNLAIWKQIQEIVSKSTLNEVKEYVAKKLTVSLQDLLMPLFGNLSELANKVGKQMPVIQFNETTGNVNLQYASKLEGIFVHIVRNAIDHGIPVKNGQIIFQISFNTAHCIIRVQDNGKGLNLNKLRAKGLNLKTSDGIIIQESSTDEEVAQLIFLSGLSTTDKITEVSGRGVGMDAVESFVHELGGNVRVEFLSKLSIEGYRQFCLVLNLPLSVISFAGIHTH